jgi:hypothetical protein
VAVGDAAAELTEFRRRMRYFDPQSGEAIVTARALS